MDLRVKTAKCASLVLSSNVSEQVLNTIIMITVARLLLPEVFGIVALATITLNILNLFNEMGISSALIYRSEKLTDATDTAFIFQLFLSLILYSIIFMSAPMIAEYYSHAEFTSILRWLGVTIVLNSLGYTQNAQLNKQLRFGKLFWVNIIPLALKGLVSITLALLNYGVWSLVLGIIFWQGSKSALLIFSAPRKPNFKIELKILRELLHYGLSLFAGGLVLFAYTSGDHFIVGKFVGLSALGFYSMASKLANMGTIQVSHVISTVSFPVFSKMQDDIGSVKYAYLKVLEYTSLLIFPLGVLMFITGDEVISLLLGDKWEPAIVSLKILIIMGIIRAIGSSAGSIFKAVGKPRIIFVCAIIQLVVAIIAILFLIDFGIEGVAVGMTLSICFGTSYGLYSVIKELQLPFSSLFNTIKPALACSSVMFVVGTLFDNFGTARLAEPLYIFLSAVLMLGSYIISLNIISHQCFLEVKHTCLNVLSGAT